MSDFSQDCEAILWLQKHCYDRLTKWEQGFVDELADRIENGEVGRFTPKQQAVLDRMWEEHVRKRT